MEEGGSEDGEACSQAAGQGYGEACCPEDRSQESSSPEESKACCQEDGQVEGKDGRSESTCQDSGPQNGARSEETDSQVIS